MPPRRLRARRDLTPTSAPVQSSRPRRAAAQAHPPTTIERSSPDEGRHSSIRLTVKSDPRKIKEATSGPAAKKSIAVNSRDVVDGEIVVGQRQRKKAIVEESSEEEEEEEEEEPEEDEELDDDEEDEDGEGEEDDAEGDSELSEDEDMDAEGEEDVDMIDVLPAGSLPKVQYSKPAVTVTPAANLLSVEDKEMAMDDDDDDDELSSLDEDAEGELDLGEDGEEDAEGDEEEEDSDEEISAGRDETPDLNKLTRRQRAAFEEFEGGGLMALSNEAQKKKHLTAEEHAMRRTEMARRRKNLSEKRNEEEKMDTINRLLKKQAPKRRRRAEIEADRIAEGLDDGEGDGSRAPAAYVRYIQNAEGSRLGVPEEWVGAPFGPFLNSTLLTGPARPFSGRMVEEVS